MHLIHAELFDELREAGFEVEPGQLGEKITTRGIGLLRLPTGTRLHIGDEAVIEITGLRNPFGQIDDFRKRLLSRVLVRDESGNLIRKAGVMSVVIKGGTVRAGDRIRVELPAPPHRPLERV